MRGARLRVGVLATALVALSGSMAHAATGAVGAPVVATSGAMAAQVADSPGAMHVLPARRVLDTRSGLGAPAGARVGGATATVTVTGHGGVPASGVGAVVLHVTAASPTGSGYVTSYPGGTAAPTASTLNVTPGQGITNLAVVPVGADGSVTLRYTGSGTVHLIADVAGWTTAGAPVEPGTTGTLAPARLMDTRTGLGGTTGRIAAGGLARLQVTGRAGVPATVGSVTLNVTVVSPTRGGWLAVTPVDPGSGAATTSSVNVVTGQTIANAVTTSLSATGTVDLRLSATTSADVVVDVVAWTVAGTPTVAGGLLASPPVRVLDTRTGVWAPPVVPGGVTTVDAGAGAAVLNVTAVGAERAGYVVISADGAGTPVAAQLTVPVSAARAALVVVPAGPNGRVRLTVSASTSMHLVVDRVGTIAQPATVGSPPGPPAALTTTAQGSGVQVSWPPVADAAGYVVRRLAARAPASPYQGAQVWNAGPGATAFTDGTPAPGVDYTYAVYSKDAGGNLSEAALATATPTPLTWTAGARVSGFAGAPVDVSCPTTTWCLAVGAFGESWVWSGGVWTASGQVPHDPNDPFSVDFMAVSCPSTTFCLAVLSGRGVAAWQSGSWTLTPTANSYVDVSCWSTTGCGLLIGEGGETSGPDFERWTDGVVGGAVAVAGHSGGISLTCPTAVCSFLSHTSGSVYVHQVSGSTVTTRSFGVGWEAQLSCATGTWCMAVVEGRYRTGAGPTWSAWKPAEDAGTGGKFVVTRGLSCPTTTSCTLVGIAGASTVDAGAQRWNGSTWSERGLGAGLNTGRAVDCAAASQCMVVDGRGRYNLWTGTAWTARTTFVNTRGGFSSLDCVSATSCMAADSAGNVLQWAGGATWPRVSVSEGRSAADCAGSTCMTVDLTELTWRVLKSATWGSTQRGTFYPYTAPICVTSTRCFALGGTTYLQWDGAGTWSDFRALAVDVGQSPAGDCPTTTFCLAVGTNGRAVQWNGTRWVSRGRAALPDGVPVSVDCVSPSFCMASAGSASAVLTPSGWHSVPAATFAWSGLGCRSATLCLGVSGGSIVAWDGVEWAMTSMAVGEPTSSGLVSCVGTARCVVVAGDRAWWTT